MERIPVDLVAGMRRAGKTTLINGLLGGPYKDLRVSVFTNELGNASYSSNCPVYTVLGGCICCTAQTELLAKIRNSLWFDGSDRLIVEMSGKGTIQDMIQIFSFLPECRLDQVIYVLDVRKFQALSTVMGSGFSEQIRKAGTLALNHWQEVSPEAREAVCGQLHQWNPGAWLLTDFGDVRLQENPGGWDPVSVDEAPEGEAAVLPRNTFQNRPAAGDSAQMKRFLREKAARKPR